MMAKERPKKNKLSIYLIKPSIRGIDGIVDDEGVRIEIENIGNFVFVDSHINSPSWLGKFFGSVLGGAPKIFSANARGLLVVPIKHGDRKATFALAFGIGRHLLKDDVYEERFGLKVALNSVQSGSFRSIVKTSLGSVPKHSREQMSRDVGVTEFGIDIEQDLVSGIAAQSRDPKFGKTIDGKDALSVSVPVDITRVKPFLTHVLDRYHSDDYKAEFDWIDQIAEVRSTAIVTALNGALVEKLRAGQLENTWMAVPEIVEWADVAGFRYSARRDASVEDDLHLPEFLAALNADPLTLEALKRAKVFMISASSDNATQWPAFRCLYSEIELNGKLYVLNNAKWYEIARDFTAQVLSDYRAIPHSTVALPECTFSNEGDYNRAVASANGMCCLDNDPIQHGGGHSKIEFCDLLTRDNRIIHVKRYGGSSVLSHLFSQGVVSGELFVSDAEFRTKLNVKLAVGFTLADPTLRPDPGDYEIVYGIISKSIKPLDLPFFSKVSLRNACRRLRGYGYKVAIKKIQKQAS